MCMYVCEPALGFYAWSSPLTFVSGPSGPLLTGHSNGAASEVGRKTNRPEHDRPRVGAHDLQATALPRCGLGKRLPDDTSVGDGARLRTRTLDGRNRRGGTHTFPGGDVEMQNVGSSVTNSMEDGVSLSLESRSEVGAPAKSGANQVGHARGETGAGSGVRSGHSEVLELRAENQALREEVDDLLGAHGRAEQAGMAYVRAVRLLSKSLLQLEQHARRAREDKLLQDSARFGRLAVVSRPDGRAHEEWQEGQGWEELLREARDIEEEDLVVQRRLKKAAKRVRMLRSAAARASEKGRSLVEHYETLRCRRRLLCRRRDDLGVRQLRYQRDCKAHQRQVRQQMHENACTHTYTHTRVHTCGRFGGRCMS